MGAGVDSDAVAAMAAIAGLRIDADRLEAVRSTLGDMLATLSALDELALGDESPEVPEVAR